MIYRPIGDRIVRTFAYRGEDTDWSMSFIMRPAIVVHLRTLSRPGGFYEIVLFRNGLRRIGSDEFAVSMEPV